MPEIKIQNLNNKRAFGSNNNNSKTVLNILHENGIDWMHACGGKGRCTTCKMTVVKGENQLSEKSTYETRFLDMGLLTQGQRLTCQSYLEGDIEIRVPNTGKLPHIKYSD